MLVLSLEHTRVRQQRLLREMAAKRIDLAIIVRRDHVQWLTGCWYSNLFEPMAALDSSGRCYLAAPSRKLPAEAPAEIVPFAAQWTSTLRNDQRAAAAEALLPVLPQNPRRLGVEFSTCGLAVALGWGAEPVDLEPTLLRLRRRKEPDELGLLQTAIDATGAMYQRAREIIAPGLSELEMFNQLQGVAVEHLGEPLTGTGNDYACNARGGPPRRRRCQDGELYILDLGPACRGYFADTCRTLAVNRRPTDAQLRAWEQIVGALRLVEQCVRPGVSCQELFFRVKQHLDSHLPGNFNHHLGHGIGLFPHEAPHLNPDWDDVFEEGDVFTAEPGLYTPELRAGIRLENNYRVTAAGVALLSDFPLELS
jgi:Xaa-Pro aminopeptidase